VQFEIILALILSTIAVFLFWQSARQRQDAGLPAGRVIYADTSLWGPVKEPLYDPVLGLTGKPDYLVEYRDSIVPVEVKSTRISHSPYDSHIYQLAAYCILVEQSYGKRPPYGILHYPNRTYAVDFSHELEDAVLDLIDEIRMKSRKRKIDRSHHEVSRCSRCGYRKNCDQALK
jgi:CRISPR-associated exonuclease Cas4